MQKRYLQCGRYRLSMEAADRPLIMGILNITPDSFSDGGRFHSLDFALSRAEQMIAEGVDIIDIGGESTRPGAVPLSVEEELHRIMPAIYALRDCGKPLSIDTYKPEVMREAIAAGVDMINDINGFRAEGALRAVKDSDCAVCIMHMQRDPGSMQVSPEYEDVIEDIVMFLLERMQAMEIQDVHRRRVCVDPGFGFGKTLDHNLALLRSLGQIAKKVGLPVLVGLSRKSMIGALLGKPVEQRMAGSVAAALLAVQHGARIVRVHDVAETVDALQIWQAIENNNQDKK